MEFSFARQLRDCGVACVFNTEEPFEHPYCGEKLVGPYTYEPRHFEAEGIQVHLSGWVDLGVPSYTFLGSVVDTAISVLDKGGKIAVHCHAGFGRTGLLIACILIRWRNMCADDAIAAVRSRRPRCIQNELQRKFVKGFYKSELSLASSSSSLSKRHEGLGCSPCTCQSLRSVPSGGQPRYRS